MKKDREDLEKKQILTERKRSKEKMERKVTEIDKTKEDMRKVGIQESEDKIKEEIEKL